MSQPPVIFDRVWKKFLRGERHDSLRDLVPALARGLFRKTKRDELNSDREFWALRDVSFEVQQGEALGIIGPNGAGKSTTLKLLTKILRPTRGACSVRGRVGALIEVAAGFHPDLTGRENIFLQGAIMGMRRAEIATRLDEITEFAGVADFIDTPVKRYSSGMNARLGFSIAAHLEPEVLIVDEVLSVGDAAFQRKCVTRMTSFRDNGTTIVFVSHDLQAISNLCGRAVLLRKTGPIVGTTQDVVGAYLQDSLQLATSASSGVRFTSSELLNPAGTNRSARSGDDLTIRLNLEVRTPTPDLTLGLIVYRSTDNLIVYEGNAVGAQCGLDTGVLGNHVVDIHFKANLVRGHYHAECYALHTPTHEYLARQAPAAIFAIDDDTSCGGVADVHMRASVPQPATR